MRANLVDLFHFLLLAGVLVGLGFGWGYSRCTRRWQQDRRERSTVAREALERYSEEVTLEELIDYLAPDEIAGVDYTPPVRMSSNA